jgi:Fe-Mn family superoxide dismutase
MEPKTYKARQFDLSGLNGISDQTLEIHFKLYEGYVTNTNSYNARIAELLQGGLTPEKTPAYSELTRRLGFEYNGMVLHEYYFGNMKRQGGGEPGKGTPFASAVENTYGSIEAWKADFVGIGKMRGVGWAITYLDPANGYISNHWVTLHEDGNIAGFVPVLIMDVWEHAFLLDYKPADRPKYIDAFLSNVDWDTVDRRVSAVTANPNVR